MIKKLKAGKIFTMYNHVWQVQKCTRWPCGSCELFRYWKSLPVKRNNNPCGKLCRCDKEIIPSNCVAVLIK